MTAPQPRTILGCGAGLIALTANGAVIWWALRPLTQWAWWDWYVPAGIASAAVAGIVGIAVTIGRGIHHADIRADDTGQPGQHPDTCPHMWHDLTPRQ